MLRLVDGIDDLLDLRDWFAHNPVIALDTETTGYGVYEPGFEVRTIQFGNADESWVVPFQRWVGFIEELIRRYDGTFRIHNSRFDIEALSRSGVHVPWHAVDDTMIAMRLSEPHLSAGLKEASVRHVSRAAAEGQKDLIKAMRVNKWTWATIPLDFPAFFFYAAMDTILGFRLGETSVCQQGFRSPIYSLEMDTRQVCTRMERGGMRVDLGLCADEMQAMTMEVEDIKSDIMTAYGFNLMSNTDLARWLMGEGAKLTVLTEKGAPSVAKDALELARLDAPEYIRTVMDGVLRVRKLQKLASSYFENFIEMNVDGILHPSIETIAAKTGRMSIRNPALQTLPRVSDIDPESKRVRHAVVPRNEGEMLISSDYEQIELRGIASLSGDRDLQAAFRKADEEGSDFFTETLRDVYADPSLGKGDPRRNLMKTLWYAASYGAGVTKMAASAGVPVAEMRDVHERVFRRYPGVKGYMKVCEREALENDNWITTPAGRRIWVDPEQPYKALNARIQGWAGDVFKQAVVDMAHADLDEFMVIPVHDEILMSVPLDIVEDVRQTIGEVMPMNSMAVPIVAAPSPPCERWSEVAK